MRYAISNIVLFLAIYCSARQHYLNKWAVHIPGGVREARRVAHENGFRFVRQVMNFFYIFFY